MKQDQFDPKPLDPKTLNLIRLYLRGGYTVMEVARKVAVSHQRLRRLVTRYGWEVEQPYEPPSDLP